MARFGLSRKAEYAVIALARLAQRRQAGRAAAEVRMSARELAEMENLPLPVLSGLLKQLQRARLVASTRGVHGGYQLAVPPERLPLASVVRAVEDGEPVQLARCCTPAPAPGSFPGSAPGSGSGSARASESASGSEAGNDSDAEAAPGHATAAETLETCRIACTCPIRHAIQSLDRQLSDFLERLTLAELMTE